MSQPPPSLKGRLERLLHSLESGRHPGRARLEETLTDGYAWALTLDAECARLERDLMTSESLFERHPFVIVSTDCDLSDNSIRRRAGPVLVSVVENHSNWPTEGVH